MGDGKKAEKEMRFAMDAAGETVTIIREIVGKRVNSRAAPGGG